ncbi:hypothetical protein HMPREF0880_04011 [Yokenella regensburgei ATCC 43003]|nr:hypothetical protein HMPREF0880_04011 [Yokenella regensburgei ATCC 43003]
MFCVSAVSPRFLVYIFLYITCNLDLTKRWISHTLRGIFCCLAVL